MFRNPKPNGPNIIGYKQLFGKFCYFSTYMSMGKVIQVEIDNASLRNVSTPTKNRIELIPTFLIDKIGQRSENESIIDVISFDYHSLNSSVLSSNLSSRPILNQSVNSKKKNNINLIQSGQTLFTV